MTEKRRGNRRISIYPGPPITRLLDLHRGSDGRVGNVSRLLSTVVERYLLLVDKLTPELSPEEWLVLLDGCPKEMTVEIRGMSLVERVAILEVAERYWATRSPVGSAMEGL